MKTRIILAVFLLFIGCSGTHNGVFKTSGKTITVHLASVNNNVCKKLYGHTVLYAVFVDTKETKPWSEYDILSTLDSIKKAAAWLELQAKKQNILLEIEIDYPKNHEKIPVALDFPKKTLSATLFQHNLSLGVRAINNWSDKLSTSVAKTLPPDTSKIIATRNTMNSKERLIARLRDIYKTDNVALLFFINNYYKEEMSVTFNTNSSTNIEYSIVSFKQPSVIAHEFLHLFGAWDLYITPFESRKKEIAKKEFAMKEFPNEIMAFAYRNIDSLEISPFTRYCIGWDKQLDKKYTDMILGKNLVPAKY